MGGGWGAGVRREQRQAAGRAAGGRAVAPEGGTEGGAWPVEQGWGLEPVPPVSSLEG